MSSTNESMEPELSASTTASSAFTPETPAQEGEQEKPVVEETVPQENSTNETEPVQEKPNDGDETTAQDESAQEQDNIENEDGAEEQNGDEQEDNQEEQDGNASTIKRKVTKRKSAQKSPPPMGPKYSYRAARSPLKNMASSMPLKPPFDLSGNVNISIPEYDPLYDDNLQLHYQHSAHTRKVLQQQRLIDRKGMITEMGDDKKRVHKERAKVAAVQQKKLLKEVQKEKMKKEKLKLQMQLQKEKEVEQKRKRVLKMKREHEKRLEAMQAKMTALPKEAQIQMMLKELDRQGIKYKLTDEGIVLTTIPTGSKSPSKKRASKSPSKKKGKKSTKKKDANGEATDAVAPEDDEAENADTEQPEHENTAENADTTEAVPESEPAQNTSITSSRIQNKSNDLFLEIDFSGTPEEMPKDGSVRLVVHPEADKWTQHFTMENGFITNVATGLRLTHGAQDAPFAVMMPAADEDNKQVWTLKGACLISAHDETGLTISAAETNSQVDIRPFDVEAAPKDCNWEIVTVGLTKTEEPSA